ncbi:hypothetical protein NCAS_0J02040 [Naumovozyma castellii]|uniref:Damage-regulated import facilitator 1 n=1 Tax=Naumovozyma castellii TaxID=27288 RepID=G0VKZ5_NAUCA|nr:hypothetical protein NCAS_0J01920 [Naumovozyma castellii CBS 4309]XP_003678521.1 hypothetical protein NCAS_0J02040 [Naumovozyma castellii CBS 4309]CCC72171.1 hypothetical protein NCAS_0J01920 [Naumovozyma castellii CBS 4309]CCC72183.1 hypothetical protein NCAS_0J02040 [Naumovozyma castellii CBS 4309]
MMHPGKQTQTSSVPAPHEQYNCQQQLSTVGMRIRQKIDQGYQFATTNNVTAASLDNTGAPVRDYASMVVPQFNTRLTVPQSNFQPPMLVNQRTVSTSSSLDMFNRQQKNSFEEDDEEILYNRKRRV